MEQYLLTLGFQNEQGTFSHLATVLLSQEEAPDRETAMASAVTILGNICGELHVRAENSDFQFVTAFVTSEETAQEGE